MQRLGKKKRKEAALKRAMSEIQITIYIEEGNEGSLEMGRRLVVQTDNVNSRWKQKGATRFRHVIGPVWSCDPSHESPSRAGETAIL